MTNANVTKYRIEDLTGKTVANHRQNNLCKTHWGDLLKFSPLENFTITPYGEDEEETEWEGDTVSLKIFIDKLKANKAQFNTFAEIFSKK